MSSVPPLPPNTSFNTQDDLAAYVGSTELFALYVILLFILIPKFSFSENSPVVSDGLDIEGCCLKKTLG